MFCTLISQLMTSTEDEDHGFGVSVFW